MSKPRGDNRQIGFKRIVAAPSEGKRQMLYGRYRIHAQGNPKELPHGLLALCYSIVGKHLRRTEETT